MPEPLVKNIALGTERISAYFGCMSIPVLYSFRRCPYAMRARLAIAASEVQVELREILLREKAQAFLEISPSGTVPCLQLEDRAIDESLDIMLWALEISDREGWLADKTTSLALISECDGPFKTALDRYKYDMRFGSDRIAERSTASGFIKALDGRLDQGWLLGPKAHLADFAILPFIRQFANVDRSWFDSQAWPNVHQWLANFTQSTQFLGIMEKYPVWKPGDPVTLFGADHKLEKL